MARFKNPLNALAFAVLALNAGLSTGASNQYMGRALEIAPNLDPSRRGPADPAFQGGIFVRVEGEDDDPGASQGRTLPPG